MHAHLPSGTVTFLFTDIEGSSGLAQRYPAELPGLLAQHHAILRQSIEECGGQVFQVVGDAFCAAFETAGAGLKAALTAQRRLLEADWNPAPLRVRMGIHTGPAQVGGYGDPDGSYTGYLTLTRAQRVMSAAYGGQVLVSSPAVELLRGELPDGVELHDLGEHTLKGLAQPERLWEAAAPGLPAEFPPLRSRKAVPHNLPVQLSSFIGREQEIAQVLRLLGETRLLTLTGVGGVGKTRLALQAAGEALESFKDGVWLVELAPLANPAHLLESVAKVLGVYTGPGRPLPVVLVDFLRARNLLLILDNCEHLISACVELAVHILGACPQVRILASSREALGVAGEVILPVPSLGLAGGQVSASLGELARSEAGRSEAVQLFLERARAVRPGFVLNEQNGPAIARICQRLDGIPLAIELAAARVKMLTSEQILARLDDRFRLLTGGSRTAVPRQQTLKALIDWSYDLLSEDERLVLRRLAVFAGGWTLEAAEAVAVQGEDLDLLELLAHLIDKSLVLVDEPPGGKAARYHYLETIRQYASEKLGGEKLLESGRADLTRRRHQEYFLALAEQIEPHLLGLDQAAWMDRAEADHDNFRAALAWGLEHDPDAAIHLAGALANFWLRRGYLIEGRDWLTRILERLEASPLPPGLPVEKRKSAQAKALIGLGTLLLAAGDSAAAHKAGRQSEALAREIGDASSLVTALAFSGTTEIFLGQEHVSIPALEEAVRLARQIGDHWSLVMALDVLAFAAWEKGDREAARRCLEESSRVIRGIGDLWSRGMSIILHGRVLMQSGELDLARAFFEDVLKSFIKIKERAVVNIAESELAHVERRLGRYEQAISHYHETISVWQDLGNRPAVAHQLECLAFIARARHRPRLAARLLGAADAIREDTQTPMSAMDLQEYQPELAAVRQELSDVAFAEAWAEGRAMAMEDGVAYALEQVR